MTMTEYEEQLISENCIIADSADFNAELRRCRAISTMLEGDDTGESLGEGLTMYRKTERESAMYNCTLESLATWNTALKVVVAEYGGDLQQYAKAHASWLYYSHETKAGYKWYAYELTSSRTGERCLIVSGPHLPSFLDSVPHFDGIPEEASE